MYGVSPVINALHRAQENCGCADVVDTDEAASGRLRLVEQRIKLGNSRYSSRRKRPERNRMHAEGPHIQARLWQRP
jgi:hypothetical protein